MLMLKGTVLKIEKLSSSIDSGIRTPCFNAASTSSLERPLPDSSLSCNIRHSFSAVFPRPKSDFFGNENGEKLLGDSSKERRKFPLKIFMMTPWAISMLQPNLFLRDLSMNSFALPWDAAW